jgi:hypothetical protein
MSIVEKGFQVGVEHGFPVNWDDSPSLAAEEKGKSNPNEHELFKSRMPDILDAMEDVNYQPSEVLKLIALEQAAVVNQMSSRTTEFGLGGQGKRLESKMKALTELRKTVQEAEELSKKDILNLDGPKFEFVFGTLCDWMAESIRDCGITVEQINNIMKSFRDKVSSGQEELQQSTDRVDSN